MKRAQTTLATSALALVGVFAGTSAHATGVTAGTLIQNTATATYTSGTASGSVTSNSVTVKVDQLLNVSVAGLTTTPVTAGATSAVLSYSVTNTGNGPDTFNLVADPAVAGNAFNATVQQIVVDSNGNGVYDPGVDTVLTAGAATPVIAPDASLKVFVIAALPTSATDGQTSQVKLTASDVIGTGTPGTTFTGKGAGGSDAVVGTSGASANANDTLVASLATVTLFKTATVVDPFGGTNPVPGAVVTYSIAANVTGSGQAQSLHVTDAIPTGTTYQPGTLKLDSAALTDAADGDAGTASASGIDVNLGTLSGGTTKTVKFDVKIN